MEKMENGSIAFHQLKASHFRFGENDATGWLLLGVTPCAELEKCLENSDCLDWSCVDPWFHLCAPTKSDITSISIMLDGSIISPPLQVSVTDFLAAQLFKWPTEFLVALASDFEIQWCPNGHPYEEFYYDSEAGEHVEAINNWATYIEALATGNDLDLTEKAALLESPIDKDLVCLCIAKQLWTDSGCYKPRHERHIFDFWMDVEAYIEAEGKIAARSIAGHHRGYFVIGWLYQRHDPVTFETAEYEMNINGNPVIGTTVISCNADDPTIIIRNDLWEDWSLPYEYQVPIFAPLYAHDRTGHPAEDQAP